MAWRLPAPQRRMRCGYDRLHSEELVAVKLMTDWVDAASHSLGSQKFVNKFLSSSPLGALGEQPCMAWSIVDLCLAIVTTYESEVRTNGSPQLRRSHELTRNASVLDSHHVSKRRLEAIRSACTETSLRSVDHWTFLAWLLHHLRVEPKIFGFVESFYQHLEHIPDSDTIPPVEQLPPPTSGITSSDNSRKSRDALPKSPHEFSFESCLKRQKLTASQSQQRPSAKWQTPLTALSTIRTAHVPQSPEISTPVESSTLGTTEETTLSALRPEKRPRDEDIVPRERHDAIVAALKEEIKALRDNEERVLTLGLSWKKERDRLLEVIERMS